MAAHRFRIWLGVCGLAATILSCAAGGTALRQITELQPPQKPAFSEDGSTLVIAWEASPDELSASFDGYNLYLSNKSLMFAPVARLPEPVVLGAVHEYTLDPARNPGNAIYVQIRSRDRNGGVSLPALPEIVVPGAPEK